MGISLGCFEIFMAQHFGYNWQGKPTVYGMASKGVA
jgi:hypothetical protein